MAGPSDSRPMGELMTLRRAVLLALGAALFPPGPSVAEAGSPERVLLVGFRTEALKPPS